MADIQYIGHSCFRLKGREGIVLCDPFDRSTGLDIGRPSAHIITVSHQHPAHNNIEVVRPLKDQEEPFLIDGPGEYEVRDVLINGVRTFLDKEKGRVRGYNTAFVIQLDEVVFCHLGNLAHELSQSQLEAIGNIDVLFVPVGGGPALTPAEADDIISQIEPRVVIPMHYAAMQHSFEYQLAPLETFIHEMGLKDVVPEEKLTITSSNLPGEEEPTRITVMLPSSA